MEEDIPSLLDLHARVFPQSARRSLQERESYFRDIFFRNPWRDDALPSLVYQGSSGESLGFLGVVPRRMLMNGKPIRVAIGTQFMVEPSSRSTLVGVQLLRKLFSGPQDLSMTDGAPDFTRKIWEGLGGTTALLYSIHWTRPLRPSRYLMSLVGKRPLLASLEQVSRPFCSIADLIAARLPQSPFCQGQQTPEEELDADTLLSSLSTFSGGQALRPEYDRHAVEWLFRMAAQREVLGRFRKVMVRNAKNEIIGWYLYYCKPGGISEVVQISARNNSINAVLNHLFYHAWLQGVVALSGRVEPRFLKEFSARFCQYHLDGPWMLVHSKQPELLQAIHRGDALLTRLEGEWWMRFHD